MTLWDTRWHDELDSTQDHARRLLEAGQLTRPTAVAARRQTAGRGSDGKSWLSTEPTGLWVTVALPRGSCLGPPSLALGLAACRALRRLPGVAAHLKWPNDVLLGAKKVAGCLCEGWGDWLLLGAGLNLSQDAFPPELADHATSVALAGRTAPGADRMLTLFLEELAQSLTEPALSAAWTGLSRLPGVPVTLVRHGERREAVALALEDDGALLIRLGDGSLESLCSVAGLDLLWHAQ